MFSGKIHYKWSFSIAMLNCQRVKLHWLHFALRFAPQRFAASLSSRTWRPGVCTGVALGVASPASNRPRARLSREQLSSCLISAQENQQQHLCLQQKRTTIAFWWFPLNPRALIDVYIYIYTCMQRERYAYINIYA